MTTPEQFKAERIAAQKPRCPVCGGTGLCEREAFGGKIKVRGACSRCADFEHRLDKFCRGFFNPQYVLPRYWHAVYLNKLEPFPACRLPMERQAKLLRLVREDPHQGYALFGAPQTGKTTVTVGLYAKLLYDELMSADMGLGYRIPVRRLSTKQMLDQQQAWQVRNLSAGLDEDVDEPEVSRESVIRCFKQGSKYRLFLEEIDKVKETEARRANLFETLDTLFGCEGQLVITSNLTSDRFAEQMGGDLMGRVTAMCRIVNLYE